jgi:imidazolonepropionase
VTLYPPTGSLVVRRIGRLLTMDGAGLGVVEDAAVVVEHGRVGWIGKDRDLPVAAGVHRPELDVAGACVTPGFVDPHTHLVWAGSRRQDFVDRLAGVPYADILGRGGGIHSTVRATRAASDVELTSLMTERAWSLIGNGTTTVEVKSGYGLAAGEELRLLDVVASVAHSVPLRVEPTYLGAHAVPPDRDREEYVDEVVATLGSLTGRARWCDVFCDRGAFTVDEARRVLDAARAAGLGLRLHADQIERVGATALAAEVGCTSADHLDHIDDDGARALAAAGVVAVLLPACTLTMGHGNWGAADRLRVAGATIALGTDCNPGTSWCDSMPYAVQLACLAYRMPVEMALRAATVNAAAALRREDIGRLAIGAWGDLAVLRAEHEADLVAHLGVPAVAATVVGGRVVRKG